MIIGEQRKNVWAKLDTGAEISVVAKSEVQKEGIPIGDETCIIEGIKGLTFECQLTKPIVVELNNKKRHIKFAVVPNLTESRFLLGLEDMTKLGIEVRGIPAKHTEDGQDLVDKVETWDFAKFEAWDESHRAPEGPRIEAELQELLRQNDLIPDDSRSSHPAAVIKYEVVDNPIFVPQYPFKNALQRKAVAEQVLKWTANGVIKKLKTMPRWHSPLLPVTKPDEMGRPAGTRVCLDVRALNARILTPMENHLPRISEVTGNIMEQEIISLFDIKSAYHRMWLHESICETTGFSFEGEYYHFVGAPFGIKTLVGEFQKFMLMLLGDIKGVLLYLDNIMVASNNEEEHLQACKEILVRCNAANLKLNTDKIHVGYEIVHVLGHVIRGARRGRSRSPSQAQMEKVMRIPFPQTGKQVRALLGLTSFLRDFIPNYAAIMDEFEQLRNVKQVAKTESLEKSLAWVKEALKSAPILSAPREEVPYMLATDGSGSGLGAVLIQHYDGRDHYIRFAATSLAKYQRSYSTTARELLALVFGLNCFEYLLLGNKFTVITDHSALSFLFRNCKFSAALSRYAQTILKFDFDVIHKPGVQMVLPDSLSRLYSELDEATSIFTEPSQKEAMETGELTRKFRVLQVAISEAPPTETQAKEWMANIGLAQVTDVEEQKRLLTEMHGLGHEGYEAIMRRIMEMKKVWPTLQADAQLHVAKCIECASYNIRRKGYHPIRPVESSLPWEHLAIDLAELRTSRERYTWCLIITDVCTRFVVLKPLRTKYAAEVAMVLLDVCALMGLPNRIQSDRGKEFVNQVLREMFERLAIAKRTTSAYHPRGNAAAETMVRLFKNALKKTIKGDWANWEKYLAGVQVYLNSRITRRHNSSPFSLMYGRKMFYSQRETNDLPPPMSDDELIDRFTQVQEIVMPAINEATKRANAKMTKEWLKKHKLVEFPPGTTVLLQRSDKSSKLEAEFAGPYRVVRQTKGGSYVIEDADGVLNEGDVPPSRLRKVAGPIDPHIYQVEKLLNHRGEGSNLEYLVKWEGFGLDQATWESVADIFTTQSIENYWQRRGNA